jgi:hypothetical protein
LLFEPVLEDVWHDLTIDHGLVKAPLHIRTWSILASEKAIANGENRVLSLRRAT